MRFRNKSNAFLKVASTGIDCLGFPKVDKLVGRAEATTTISKREAL
jgi:hypothetical protein